MELRCWSADDAPALRDASTSSPDLATQLGGATLTSLDQAEQFITEQLVFTDSCRNWAIINDGVAIGNVGLAAIEWRHETAWAYYWLASSARRRGHAAGALAAVSAWAFDQGLFRLELGHRTNNPASCNVALRAGYPAEGVERQKLRYGTERFNTETHARLRTDPAPDVTGLALISAH